METTTIKEETFTTFYCDEEEIIHNKNDEIDHDDEDEDENENEEESGHDEDECDSSGHCQMCCKLSRCTTKDEWARQGQYECYEGMYFPCTICEPQFNGVAQYTDKYMLENIKN
jgi:hypothetical protein